MQAVFQLVVPRQGQFPTVRLHVGCVLLRFVGTQDAGKQTTRTQHAGSLTLVVVEGTRQAVAQNGEVQAEVPLRHLFPRHGVAHQAARQDVAYLLSAEEVTGVAAAVSGQVGIPAIVQCLVGLAAIRGSDLQVIEEVACGICKPFFLAQSPSKGEGGAEHGAVVLRELGRKVITSVQLQQVTVVEGVVDAGESASRGPTVIRVAHASVADGIAHRGQIVVDQLLAISEEIACVLGLLVVAQHGFEVMLAPRLFVVAHEVERIVRVVVLVFLYVVGVGVLEYLQEASAFTIFVERGGVVLVVFCIIVERIVHLDAQSIQRLDFHGHRVPKVVLRGLACATFFQHGGKVGVVALPGPMAVRMLHRHQGRRVVADPRCSVGVVLGNAVQFGADIRGLHRDVQPIVHIIADVVHQVELAVLLIAVAQQGALVHVAHGSVVRGLVATTADVDIVLLQRVALLVDFFHPVRVAAVAVFALRHHGGPHTLRVTRVVEHRVVVHRVIVISLNVLHVFLGEVHSLIGVHGSRVHPVHVLHGVHVFRTCRGAVPRNGGIE